MVMDNVITLNAEKNIITVKPLLRATSPQPLLFLSWRTKKINPYLDSLLNSSPRWLDTVTGDKTARTYVPIDINPFITHPAHERLYHTTGVYAPYSLRTTVWVLLRPTRIKTAKELWDRAYGFSSLSEKTRNSNCLQMSQQRQHILLRCFKTLSVGLAVVWTCDLPLSRPALKVTGQRLTSPQWPLSSVPNGGCCEEVQLYLRPVQWQVKNLFPCLIISKPLETNL